MDRGKNKYTCPAIQTVRNLPKSQLGAVIFGCRNHTLSECMNKKLFGLPSIHYSYVKNIDPGLPLFLFNCSDRKLHGIFKAVSCGQLNIDDQAWAYCERADYTPYAAQVQIDFHTKCRPLVEDEFKSIIKRLQEKVPSQPKKENTPRPRKAAKLINMFDALSISDTNEAKPDDEFENLDSQKGSDVSYTSVLVTSCAQKKWTGFFTGSSSSREETSNSHDFDRWEDHALECWEIATNRRITIIGFSDNMNNREINNQELTQEIVNSVRLLKDYVWRRYQARSCSIIVMRC